MATYRLTGPDGSTYRVTAPDSASREEVLRTFHAQMQPPAQANATPPASPASPGDQFKEGLSNFYGKNAVMGGLRGAASLGAPLQHYLNPAEWGNSAADAERRAGIDGGVLASGADPSSMEFRGAKLATEVAGTAGAGSVLATPLRLAGPAWEPLANALASSGFTTGAKAAPNMLARAMDIGTRTIGGAAAGGAQAAMVDPEHAGTASLIGGALPGAAKAVGAAGGYVGGKAGELAEWAAQKLMNSALKPTLPQKQSGEAATAVETLLDYGINPTKAGVEKLQALISELNGKITNAVSGSTARVGKQPVLNALSGTRAKFGNQVDPAADLAAIDRVEQGFLNHPLQPGADMPVQAAQDMKQGTYRVLRGKYGQMGSAETEAQKSLARGLKDEIASAVPGVGAMNAEESRLIATLNVAERRALMDLNKNPLGLAALAVHEPSAFIAFMADKSAAFKSLAARAINSAGKAPVPGSQAFNALAAPAAYRALPLAAN